MFTEADILGSTQGHLKSFKPILFATRNRRKKPLVEELTSCIASSLTQVPWISSAKGAAISFALCTADHVHEPWACRLPSPFSSLQPQCCVFCTLHLRIKEVDVPSWKKSTIYCCLPAACSVPTERFVLFSSRVCCVLQREYILLCIGEKK